MYNPDPNKVLATRQFLENKAHRRVTQSQLLRVTGPDLYVWMDEKEGFPGIYLVRAKSRILGRHILEYMLTDPDLVAAYYTAIGIDRG